MATASITLTIGDWHHTIKLDVSADPIADLKSLLKPDTVATDVLDTARRFVRKTRPQGKHLDSLAMGNIGVWDNFDQRWHEAIIEGGCSLAEG